MSELLWLCVTTQRPRCAEPCQARAKYTARVRARWRCERAQRMNRHKLGFRAKSGGVRGGIWHACDIMIVICGIVTHTSGGIILMMRRLPVLIPVWMPQPASSVWVQHRQRNRDNTKQAAQHKQHNTGNATQATQRSQCNTGNTTQTA